MSKAYIIREDTLVTIADAIRAQKGTTDAIPVTSLAAEIESMVDEYDGSVRDEIPVSLTSSDGSVLTDANGTIIITEEEL